MIEGRHALEEERSEAQATVQASSDALLYREHGMNP